MKPKTRLDNFLAKIAGDPDADTSMEPKSLKEHYLNEIAENGGAGGAGYSVTEEKTLVIPEQTVTSLSPDGAHLLSDLVLADDFVAPPEIMDITFNGAVYRSEVVYDEDDDKYYYTVTDKDKEIFHISMGLDNRYRTWHSNIFSNDYTEVTVKAESVDKKLEVTDDFADAVKTVAGSVSTMIVTGEIKSLNTTMFGMSNTVGEILDAYDSGKNIRLRAHNKTTGAVYEMPLSAIISDSDLEDRSAIFQTITKNSPYYIFNFNTSDNPASDECHLDVYELTKYDPVS